MTVEALLFLFLLLHVKHVIVDWYWQTPYELQNKMTFGHLGGIQHAGKNAIGTGLCLLPFFGVYGMILGIIVDFYVHYNIDYMKSNITYSLNLTTDDRSFWHLIGLDQFLHFVTYILIIYILI